MSNYLILTVCLQVDSSLEDEKALVPVPPQQKPKPLPPPKQTALSQARLVSERFLLFQFFLDFLGLLQTAFNHDPTMRMFDAPCSPCRPVTINNQSECSIVFSLSRALKVLEKFLNFTFTKEWTPCILFFWNVELLVSQGSSQLELLRKNARSQEIGINSEINIRTIIFQNGIRNRPSTANGHVSKTSKKERSKQRPRSAVSSSQDVSVKPLCWKPNSKNSSGSLIPDSKSQSLAFRLVSAVKVADVKQSGTMLDLQYDPTYIRTQIFQVSLNRFLYK